MVKTARAALVGAILVFAGLASGQVGHSEDALVVGVRQLNGGDYGAAVASFREAVTAQADSAEPHIWLGKALYASGAPDDAQQEWVQALRLDPANAVAKQCLSDARLIDYARSLYDEKLYEECIKALTEGLEKVPTRELMHDIDYLLAACYFEINLPLQARTFALSALHRHPVGDKRDNAELLLGRLTAREGDYDEAFTIYERVIAAYPGTDGAIEAELRIADAHEEKGENEEAARRYEEFIKRHADHALLWTAMLSQGECYRRLGDREYQRNVMTYQDGANASLNEHYRRAMPIFLSVIDGSPSKRDFEWAYGRIFTIASVYHGDQHWAAAETVYRGCLEGEREGQDEVRFRIGLLRKEQGLFEIQRLREMHRKPPGEIVAGFRNAAKEFLDLVAAFPTKEWVKKVGDAIATMSGPYRAEQMWDTARAVFQLCLGPPEAERYPLRDDMQYQVALVDFDEAAYALARQIEREPQVEGLELSNEFARAIGALQGFVTTFPKSELVGVARGKVVEVAETYARYRAWPVAIQVLEKFLKDNPDYPHPEDILLRIGICHMAKVMKEISSQEIALHLAVPSIPPTAGPAAAREWTDEEVTSAPSASAMAATAPAGPQGAIGAAYGGYGPGIAGRQPLADRAARMQQAEQQRFVQVAMAQPAVRAAARPAAVTEVMKKEKKERADAFEQARAVFQKIMDDYSQTAAAGQARGQMLRMVQYLEREGEWEEAVGMYRRLLEDNPNDRESPQLTFRIAVCLHNLANAEPVPEDDPKAALDAFDKARAAYGDFLRNYPDSDLVDAAEFALVLTHRDEGARLAASFMALAAGQYAQAHAQLEEFARLRPYSGNAAQAPPLMYQLGQSLEGVSAWEEAVACYQGLIRCYPTDAQSPGAAERIAQIERDELNSPLRAANSYLELLWQYRPGDAGNIGDTVYGVARSLESARRWVEATAAYEVFVNSFPDNANAGEALKATGDIYKGNQVWKEAIAAYEKTVEDYPEGDVVAAAQLGMAECYENLSEWKEAIAAYEKFLEGGGQPPQRESVQGKISILKDIVLYQQLIVQQVRTARLDDAQFQIATVVLEKLQNRVKGIEEFGKVVATYPTSYLADDAQFKIGVCHRELGDFPAARENFQKLVSAYHDSPLADDAIYGIGSSYEEEARRLQEETVEKVAERAYGTAQNVALQQAATSRAERRESLQRQLKGAPESAAAGALVRAQSEGMKEAKALGEQAEEQAAQFTATEMANRQDRINAALRSAVAAYDRAAKEYPLGDFADDALLRMADIYYLELKDTPRAMAAYELLVQHYPGTAVAEVAAAKLGPYYEKEEKWREAIKAYQQYAYNYPQGAGIQDAYFAIAGCYEQLEEWVNAMDAYQSFIDRFAETPRAQKAKDRIAWIKTYRLGGS